MNAVMSTYVTIIAFHITDCIHIRTSNLDNAALFMENLASIVRIVD